jgi:hypothetical protein
LPRSFAPVFCMASAPVNSAEHKRRGRGRRTSSRVRDGMEQGPLDGPASGMYPLEWVVCMQKLTGRLRVVKERLVSPAGEFVFTLYPEGAVASRNGNTRPSFQDTLGRASLHVKCISKPAPDTFLKVSLGDGCQHMSIRHDFSKKSSCWLPEAFDFWTAMSDAMRPETRNSYQETQSALWDATLTLHCTFVCRGSPSAGALR